MIKQFIPFETGIPMLAKEKGFNGECIAEYNKGKLYFHNQTSIDEFGHGGDELNTYTNSEPNFNDIKNTCSAPTYDQVREWLEKEHKIFLELIIDGWGEDDCVGDRVCYRAFVWQAGKPRPKPWDDLGASDYYKIYEVAIKYALDLI